VFGARRALYIIARHFTQQRRTRINGEAVAGVGGSSGVNIGQWYQAAWAKS